MFDAYRSVYLVQQLGLIILKAEIHNYFNLFKAIIFQLFPLYDKSQMNSFKH